MIDPMDDIARQARQGSVSAIIQVLNEKLADAGVRTRAMFDQGVLQLLCEGNTLEQLEQPVLVPQVRQILESLHPRGVRRVNINGRLVREQQLLWLEEIRRDPQQQLLWSEEITLKQLNLLQQLTQDRKDKVDPVRNPLPKTSPARLAREKRQFWRGLAGGTALSLALLGLGWLAYRQLGRSPLSLTASRADGQPADPAAIPVVPQPHLSTVSAPSDPFADAVRLAGSTATATQTAQTPAAWLEVASQWQQASDLMGKIPESDPRHKLAQDRVTLYQQNSQIALQKAEQSRSVAEEPAAPIVQPQ